MHSEATDFGEVRDQILGVQKAPSPVLKLIKVNEAIILEFHLRNFGDLKIP
jgi:hypothetical protein